MMEKPAETNTPKEKHSAFLPGFIVWPLLVLLLYVLSYGPIMMMYAKGHISPANQIVWKFYTPIDWAYVRTPLHKPLGMYLHLWVPEIFKKNGDLGYDAVL
jgi:hypothetical protein